MKNFTYIIEYISIDGQYKEYTLTTNYKSNRDTIIQNFAEENKYTKIISFKEK